jgi:hypothetical protein
MARRAKVKRWSIIGVLAVVTIGYYFFSREPSVPTGVALPDLITIPMSAGDAARMVKSYEGTTQMDPRTGGLIVRISSKTFPERRIGQLALAQQYAHADEIVMGRKRAISFIDPGGMEFAKADPAAGVMLTR